MSTALLFTPFNDPQGREGEVNSISRSPLHFSPLAPSFLLFKSCCSLTAHFFFLLFFSFPLSMHSSSSPPSKGGGAFRCVSPYQICWRCITDDAPRPKRTSSRCCWFFLPLFPPTARGNEKSFSPRPSLHQNRPLLQCGGLDGERARQNLTFPAKLAAACDVEDGSVKRLVTARRPNLT